MKTALKDVKKYDDFKVADLTLAKWGRKEIEIAESEMPGLMAIRKEFKKIQPLKRCKNFWFFAHDHSNSCFNRNLRGAWCRS